MIGQGAATVTQHLVDEVCGQQRLDLCLFCVWEYMKLWGRTGYPSCSLVQVQDAAQVFSPSWNSRLYWGTTNEKSSSCCHDVNFWFTVWVKLSSWLVLHALSHTPSLTGFHLMVMFISLHRLGWCETPHLCYMFLTKKANEVPTKCASQCPQLTWLVINPVLSPLHSWG